MCQQIAPPKASQIFTWAQIQSHNTRGDAYIVISDKVYDISNFQHPGGSVIMTHAGQDATDVFAVFHAPSASKFLKSLYVGDVDTTQDTPDATMLAYRRLRGQVKSLGLYRCSLPYYLWKAISTFGIWVMSVLVAGYAESMPLYLLSAFIMGLFYQQAGWLAHDLLHHQIVKSAEIRNVLAVVLGNVWQGLSVQWWKSKHNTHHAIPNLHGSRHEKFNGDPDIDTMPFIAWSMKMARPAKDSQISQFLIRNQAMLYFPLLLVARLSWLQQSLLHVFQKFSYTHYDESDMPNLEKLGITLHYLWNFGVMYFCDMTLFQSAAWFLFSQFSCGVLLALVFSLGHNGMTIYEQKAKPNFHTLQISTTRNIESSWWCDWFTGGLNYQTDHHLFPMVPRHNFKQLNGLVKSFCHEHKLPYHETTFWNGLYEVVSHLSTISTDFCAEFPAM